MIQFNTDQWDCLQVSLSQIRADRQAHKHTGWLSISQGSAQAVDPHTLPPAPRPSPSLMLVRNSR